MTDLLLSLLLYETLFVFACFICLLFLTDTFSFGACSHLRNELVGCSSLNIWEIFVSTDHQPWVPASMCGSRKWLRSELHNVGSSSQCSSEPASYKASGSAHKPRSTERQGLEPLEEEQQDDNKSECILQEKSFKVTSSSALWLHRDSPLCFG